MWAIWAFEKMSFCRFSIGINCISEHFRWCAIGGVFGKQASVKRGGWTNPMIIIQCHGSQHQCIPRHQETQPWQILRWTITRNSNLGKYCKKPDKRDIKNKFLEIPELLIKWVRKSKRLPPFNLMKGELDRGGVIITNCSDGRGAEHLEFTQQQQQQQKQHQQ